jgi:mannose-1-phosphate guanylyltransferase
MAGGRGERFWPLSTERLPKPFVPLLGSRTLIQDTVERLRCFVPEERILVSIGESHRDFARAQLPGLPAENFVVEPVGRDTSACLGYCALHLERRDPACWMIAVPADHYVSDREGYRRTLERGLRSLPGAAGIVFGIDPVRPETGYGYVRAEKPAVPADAWPVIRFVEKPDSLSAARYVQSGQYFWNSGIFLFENRNLLALFQRHLPATYRSLRELEPLIGVRSGAAELRRRFNELHRVSIDFGILEKTSGLRLVPAEFGWDDIGNWAALERALPADARGNVARGPHATVDSRGCIIYSDAGTVATFGVSDIVVVQANGKVLVCPKALAPELKRLVTALGPENTKAHET